MKEEWKPLTREQKIRLGIRIAPTNGDRWSQPPKTLPDYLRWMKHLCGNIFKRYVWAFLLGTVVGVPVGVIGLMFLDGRLGRCLFVTSFFPGP